MLRGVIHALTCVAIVTESQAASALVYHRTAGYYHESIPAALDFFATQTDFNVTASDDPSVFNDTYLSNFDALIFLMNSDDILDTPAQRLALFNYLMAGGGLVGIHSGNAALFDLPFFGTALGAYFDYHPDLQQASFEPINRLYLANRDLPARWTFEEEVYQYRSDPRATNITNVILTVDDSSYQDPKNGTSQYYQGGFPHPIAWLREGGVDLGNGTNTNGMNASAGDTVEQGTFIATGRQFYTSLGHLSSTWQDEVFQSHITGGINWVLAQNSPAVSVSASSPGPIASNTTAIQVMSSEGQRTLMGLYCTIAMAALLAIISN